MRQLLPVGPLALLLGLLGACGAAPTAPAAIAPATALIEKAPDSGQVDRVGPDDGSLEPDGIRDLSFVVRVDGPVVAMFLVTVDEDGNPNGDFQADTLVGATESPTELGRKPGRRTSGLGIVEGDRMLNAPDGSLGEVGPGPHRVVVYAASAPATRPGTRLRVYVLRPDQSLLAGGTVTN
jgi:hypothetical protein